MAVADNDLRLGAAFNTNTNGHLSDGYGRVGPLAAGLPADEPSKLRALIDAAPCTMSWITADLKYLAVNNQLATLFGLLPQDFVGREMGFRGPSQSSQLVQFARALFASAELQHDVELAMEVNGEKRDFYFIGHKYNAGREATIVGIDISGRKQMENALRQRAAELATLNAVVAAVNESADLVAMLTRALEKIVPLFHADGAECYILDRVGLFGLTASYAMPSEFAAYPADRHDRAGIPRRTLASRQPIYVGNLTTDPAYLRQELARTYGFQSLIAIPIIGRESPLGVFMLYCRRPRIFSEKEQESLMIIGAQLAVAIERAHLYETTRKQVKELTVLHAVATAGAEADNEDDLIARATQVIGQSLYPDNFGVLLLDEAANQLYVHPTYKGIGNSGSRLAVPLGAGITGQVAQSGRARLINDIRSDPNYIAHDPRTRAELCVPLKIGERMIGVINAESCRVNGFTTADERLLSTLASQIASALERLRAEAAEQQRTRQLAGLYETALVTTSVLDQRTLLQRLYEQVQRLMAPETFAVVFFDARANELEVALAMEQGKPVKQAAGLRVPLEKGGLTGWMIRTRQSLLVRDMQSEPLPVEAHHVTRAARSWLGAPLIARDRMIGAISVQSFSPRAFTEDHRLFLQSLAGQVAVALENVRLFEETHRRASELETLADVSSILRAARTVEEMMMPILQKATEMAGGIVGIAYLIDGESGELVARGWYPGTLRRPGRRKLGQGITGHVAVTGQLYISSDISRDPLTYLSPEEKGQFGQIHTAIAIPLRTQEAVVGVMQIGLREQRTISEEEVRLLTAIAEMTGTALQRAVVMETLEERVEARTRDLAEANERLQELDRLKSRFVSDVSHELRTPAANVLLYLDLLERGKAEKHDHYMTTLRHEANRLVTLVENVLNISRLELGKNNVQFAPVNLNGVIEKVLAASQVAAAEKGLHLHAELDPRLPAARAEQGQLSQVVTNLITNAIHYNVPDGSLCLRTFLDTGRQMVCLEVRDTGLGIEPEDLPHLFERFYRGQRAGQSNIPGTGLGLALVKEIIDLHGGDINVVSEAGRGTTFRVWLPVATEL